VLEASHAEIKFETNNKDVDTMRKGRAGHSRGAQKCTITVKNAIPQAGAEIDWAGIARAQLEVELGFRIAGKTYECVGDVRDVTVTSGTEQPNDLSFTYHGKVTSEL
jgi:hypothetical protein